MQETSDFYDDQVLPTLFQDNNLTVKVYNRQNAEKAAISIVSYASEAKFITPPMYACNVSLWGQWLHNNKVKVSMSTLTTTMVTTVVLVGKQYFLVPYNASNNSNLHCNLTYNINHRVARHLPGMSYPSSMWRSMLLC